MTEEEILRHAKRILEWHNSDFSYDLVYEDEELENATDDEQLAVHDAMNKAQITYAWPGNKAD